MIGKLFFLRRLNRASFFGRVLIVRERKGIIIKKLGIVIPVFNEGENIARTVKAIETQVRTPHAIYILYDLEEDTTIPVARKLATDEVKIELIRNPLCGVANGIKTGLRTANHPYLLVTMADLSDDYSVVDRMCALMDKGYDLVCGSRYSKGGAQIGGPLLKKTLSRLAGISLFWLAGIPTRDVTNSFKLYRKRLLDSLVFESSGGFEIGMELVVKAHAAGYKVGEVPCVWRDRQEGKSNFKLLAWLPKYVKWYFYALKKRRWRILPQSRS